MSMRPTSCTSSRPTTVTIRPGLTLRQSGGKSNSQGIAPALTSLRTRHTSRRLLGATDRLPMYPCTSATLPFLASHSLAEGSVAVTLDENLARSIFISGLVGSYGNWLSGMLSRLPFLGGWPGPPPDAGPVPEPGSGAVSEVFLLQPAPARARTRTADRTPGRHLRMSGTLGFANSVPTDLVYWETGCPARRFCEASLTVTDSDTT